MSGTRPSGHKDYIYPNPLPHFNKEPTTDDLGFTTNEKAALQNLMRALKAHLKLYIFTIHNDFFATNYKLLEHFRYYDRLDVRKLSEHYIKVVSMYETSIERGLDSCPFLQTILIDMEAAHIAGGVQKNEIALMTDAIKAQFLDVLQPISSSTLVAALDKLSARFIGSWQDDYSSSHTHSEILE